MCAEKQNNDQNQGDINASEGKKESGAGRDKPNASRRKFLKLGLAGAGAAAVAAGGLTAIKRMEGIPHDEFPLPVRDDFKRIDSHFTMTSITTFKLIFVTVFRLKVASVLLSHLRQSMQVIQLNYWRILAPQGPTVPPATIRHGVPLSFGRLWRKNTNHPLCGWSLTQLEVM
jgi:hypothetical protein